MSRPHLAVGRGEKTLQAALEKHPNYAEAWENLAHTRIALERPAEAAKYFPHLLALQPDRAGVREHIESFETGLTLAAGR